VIKHVVSFVTAVTVVRHQYRHHELFSVGFTAEALRANIGSKSAISFQRGLIDPKF